MLLFLVPYSFFLFVALGEVCPGASTVAKSPSSQPISLLAVFYSLSSVRSYEDRTLDGLEFLSYLGWSDPRDDCN